MEHRIKKRKDSFWGIHTDFHARPWMGAVGCAISEDDIRKICRTLRPDFWQIDCKGHFGYASYPTSLGNAMPEIATDILALFRKVTHEEGVALYMHYSGLWDDKYLETHPEAGVMHPDGTYDKSYIFPASSYVDDLLIPQLSELAEKYRVDGVWIDGDCWAMRLDYRPETLAAFEKETGISLNGKKPVEETDPYFDAYSDYQRELYRRYARHYVDTLHERFPHLQITSNWLFSDMMPEKVSIGIDYISGDAMPFNTLNAIRYAARYLPQQKMPWDIMGMAQRYSSPEKTDLLPVHPTQVIQQAAATISLGGAFQAGMSQYFDGSPRMIPMLNLKPVADFLRAREPFCFGGQVIPQVAMFVSAYDRHRERNYVFGRGLDHSFSKRGLCSLLCAAGQSCEMVSEHTLEERIDDFSMIVLPETIEALDPMTVKALLAYAERGGSLLLTGVRTCSIFAEAGAPFRVEELDDEVPTERFLGQQHDAADERFFTLDDTAYGGVLYPKQILASHGETIATTYYSERSRKMPYAVIVPYGKGKIATIASDIGKAYDEGTQYLHRELVKTISARLYTPLARIESACGSVDIVCLEKNGRLMLQALNGNGNHLCNACDTEDRIPPVLDIELSIAMKRPPQRLMLQPEGEELPFTFRDGRVYTTVKRLDMHNIVEVIEE